MVILVVGYYGDRSVSMQEYKLDEKEVSRNKTVAWSERNGWESFNRSEMLA